LKVWLGEVADLETQTERVNKLRALKFNLGGMWWVLILVSVVELGLGIVFCLMGGWS
jgi:hypothetical protein